MSRYNQIYNNSLSVLHFSTFASRWNFNDTRLWVRISHTIHTHPFSTHVSGDMENLTTTMPFEIIRFFWAYLCKIQRFAYFFLVSFFLSLASRAFIIQADLISMIFDMVTSHKHTALNALWRRMVNYLKLSLLPMSDRMDPFRLHFLCVMTHSSLFFWWVATFSMELHIFFCRLLSKESRFLKIENHILCEFLSLLAEYNWVD